MTARQKMLNSPMRIVRSLNPQIQALAERKVAEMVRSASQDAGNRSMRAAGRTVWNADDYNAACAEFERLSPQE